MYEAESHAAARIVSEVCSLGRAVQRRIVAEHDHVTKDDRSPVTIADLATQVVVSARLSEAFPGVPLLAEEDSAALADTPGLLEQVLELARRILPDLDEAGMLRALDRGDHAGGARGRHWVLDPIDGTKGFLRGDQYAVALALVEDGEVVVGTLGCPNLAVEPAEADGRTGCLFVAARGSGTRQADLDGGPWREVSVDPGIDPTRAVFCESVDPSHSSHTQHAAIAARVGTTSPPFRIDSQCKYGVVARGQASIYMRLASNPSYREKVWDHAAGSLVVTEAGGRVTDLEGRALDFSQGRLLDRRHGILVTNGGLHDQVLHAARAEVGLS